MSYSYFPLDLPKGWKVLKNEFYDIDHQGHIPEDDKFFYLFDLEDMLFIQKGDYILDMGWHGENDGDYCIHFFKGTWDNGILLEKHVSNDRFEIAQRINEILYDFENGRIDETKGYYVSPDNKSDFSELDDFRIR